MPPDQEARPGAGWFVLVAGWPASGKSTLARARYQARGVHRHAGHLDAERSEAELWGAPPRSPGHGPVLAVDTSGPVDIPQLAATLTRILGSGSGTQVP